MNLLLRIKIKQSRKLNITNKLKFIYVDLHCKLIYLLKKNLGRESRNKRKSTYFYFLFLAQTSTKSA